MSENIKPEENAVSSNFIQDFIDEDTEGWPELESTWEAIRVAYQDNEGNQVGYPVGYSYPGIYYNADMLEEAGIDRFLEEYQKQFSEFYANKTAAE